MINAKKSLAFLLIAAATLGSSLASAADTSAYVVDARGNVAKSGFGLCWHTGYWTPAQALPECESDLTKDAAAAAAKTAAPAAAPAPANLKAKFSADTLFDFNKADLKPEGKAKLDELATKIKSLKSIEAIISVGHADRFGTDAYNQKLSEKRAQAVKTYLVSKGIDAKSIYTEGKGKKQPVTKADQCKGPKSKKVIDCLQPDRRVEVEVIGNN